MTLHEQIRSQIKEAMIAKDAVRLTVLRGLVTSFTNELVATKRTPQDLLTDEETLNMIRRAVKQRKDSIEQFTAGGRADLAADEQAELVYLEAYLPQMMSIEEIKTFVEAKKTELGITDKAMIGKFTGTLMKDLKGKADGMDVKTVVDGLFN